MPRPESELRKSAREQIENIEKKSYSPHVPNRALLVQLKKTKELRAEADKLIKKVTDDKVKYKRP